MDTSTITTINTVLPIIVETLKVAHSLTDTEVDNLTLKEIKELLESVEWPDFEFKSSK